MMYSERTTRRVLRLWRLGIAACLCVACVRTGTAQTFVFEQTGGTRAPDPQEVREARSVLALVLYKQKHNLFDHRYLDERELLRLQGSARIGVAGLAALTNRIETAATLSPVDDTLAKQLGRVLEDTADGANSLQNVTKPFDSFSSLSANSLEGLYKKLSGDANLVRDVADPTGPLRAAQLRSTELYRRLRTLVTKVNRATSAINTASGQMTSQAESLSGQADDVAAQAADLSEEFARIPGLASKLHAAAVSAVAAKQAVGQSAAKQSGIGLPLDKQWQAVRRDVSNVLLFVVERDGKRYVQRMRLLAPKPTPAAMSRTATAPEATKPAEVAGEIVVGALKDRLRTLIVGDTRTYSSGTIQSLFDMGQLLASGDDTPKLGVLRLNHQLFYGLNGTSVQMRGIAPDITLRSWMDANAYGEPPVSYPIPADTVARLATPLHYLVTTGLVNDLLGRSEERRTASKQYQQHLERMLRQRERALAKVVSLNQAKFDATHRGQGSFGGHGG
jgi:Peptidase family S41